MRSGVPPFNAREPKSRFPRRPVRSCTALEVLRGGGGEGAATNDFLMKPTEIKFGMMRQRCLRVLRFLHRAALPCRARYKGGLEPLQLKRGIFKPRETSRNARRDAERLLLDPTYRGHARTTCRRRRVCRDTNSATIVHVVSRVPRLAIGFDQTTRVSPARLSLVVPAFD